MAAFDCCYNSCVVRSDRDDLVFLIKLEAKKKKKVIMIVPQGEISKI